MTRILISLLVGSLFTAGAVIAADTATGVMFVAGAICLLILQAAILCSARRARAVAHFILGVCDTMEHRQESRQRAAVKQGRAVSQGMRREFRESMKSDEKPNHREASRVRAQWASNIKVARPAITPAGRLLRTIQTPVSSMTGIYAPSANRTPESTRAAQLRSRKDSECLHGSAVVHDKNFASCDRRRSKLANIADRRTDRLDPSEALSAVKVPGGSDVKTLLLDVTCQIIPLFVPLAEPEISRYGFQGTQWWYRQELPYKRQLGTRTSIEARL